MAVKYCNECTSGKNIKDMHVYINFMAGRERDLQTLQIAGSEWHFVPPKKVRPPPGSPSQELLEAASGPFLRSAVAWD